MGKNESNMALAVIVFAVAACSIAAVSAIAVIGYPALPRPSDHGSAPALTFSMDSPASGAWTAEVVVGRPVVLSSYRISLVNETSSTVIIQETVLTQTFVRTAGGVTLRFMDLAGAGQLTSGDRFLLSGIVFPYRYTLNIMWVSTGAVITSVTLPSV